jgi:hypothetical protein
MKNSSFLFLTLFFLTPPTMFVSAQQQCGSINRASNKTGNASSTDALVSSVGGAVDANLNTYWKPNGAGGAEWIYFDLGSAYKDCQVIIKWGRWNAPSAFKIEGTTSDPTQSGVTWTELANVTNPNPTAGPGDAYAYNDQTITVDVNSRYLRVYMPTVGSSENIWVKELEVFSTITNQAPTCVLTAPSNNISITAGTPITLAASATDTDGQISKVEFFYNGSSLIPPSPLTQSPYSITWVPANSGTYVVTAKATDNNTAATTSNAVTITVNPPSPSWSLAGNSLSDPNSNNVLGTTDNQPLIFISNNSERMRITADGKVLVNTSTPHAWMDFGNMGQQSHKLAVNGGIIAKRIQVTLSNWADYVFDSSYKLRPIKDLENFITQYKHLPDVPTAKEVENRGLDVGDQHAVILRKVEELTLYIIQQQKIIEEQQRQIDSLKKKLDSHSSKKQKRAVNTYNCN